MAQVPYLTDIYLYKNVPLAPNYTDTIYFTTALAQLQWFSTYQFKYYGYQMFQRFGRNRCRVEGNPRLFTGVNYMVFKNLKNPASETDRTWFAFVTDVEYINENVVEIRYEIDVMQTFMFDYDLLQCYVERQHSETDNIGDNLLEEPISIGDYVINEITTGVSKVEPTDGNGNSKQLGNLAYVVAMMPLIDIPEKGSIRIITQPTNQIVNVGSFSAKFEVVATGVNLKFYWRVRYPVPNPVGGGQENYDWTPFVPDGTRWTKTDSSSGDTYTSKIELNGGGGAAISDNVTYFDCRIVDEYGYDTYCASASLIVNP